MEGGVIDEEDERRIRAEAEAAVQGAVEFALASPEPEVVEAFTDVFAEGC